MIELVLKSLIVGVLVGGSIAAGAVRMFKAPEVMGMGAFRTLGELVMAIVFRIFLSV